MAWDSGVAVPSTSAYGPPQVDFSILGNLYNTYQQSQRNKQEQQQNDLILQKQRNDLAQQQKLQGIFANGIPKDAQGNLDFRAITEQLAKAGDVNAIQQLYPAIQQQSAGQVSPLLQGGGSPPASGAAAAPVGDLPPTAGRPQGATASAPDASATGGTSLTGIVAGQLGDADPRTGPTMLRIAQALGVDPNQRLTLGQQRRAQGLLDRYAGSPTQGSTQVASAAPVALPAAPPTPAQQIQARFGGAQTGAPQPAPAPQPVPQPPVQSAPATPPVQSAPTPIVPKVPLPQGFTDPQKAILALRAEAARLSPNPYNAGQVKELNDYAKRIEDSLQPVTVTSGQTILSPTGDVLYKGASQGLAPEALKAAAERYRKTGTFPAGMSRGVQGDPDRRAIQELAAQQEVEAGGDTADWPKKWQQFKAEQIAIGRFESGPQGNTVRSLGVVVDHIGTMRQLGEALHNGDIPAFNRIAQAWAQATGNKAPTNAEEAAHIVGAEVVKAIGIAGAGTKDEREGAASAFSKSASPEQFFGVIDDVVRPLMLGQLKGLRRQFVVSTGLPASKFDAMLGDDAQAFFAGGGNEKSGGGGGQGTWTTLPGGVRVREVK